jgi:hypothetical protein
MLVILSIINKDSGRRGVRVVLAQRADGVSQVSNVKANASLPKKYLPTANDPYEGNVV